MSLDYYLQPNPVTPDPNDQSARVATRGNLTEDDLAAELVKRGTATSKAQALAVITALHELIAEKVADGYAVNTSLCTIRAAVNGVFTDPTDTFDPARHTIRANLASGTALDDALAQATVSKKSRAERAPRLTAFLNKNTGGVNATLTSGGIGQIVGEELKFDPAKPADGIYLVPATGTAVKVTNLATRTEGELLFLTPTLTAGTYRLEVRRTYGTANPVVRTGQLSTPLTAA